MISVIALTAALSLCDPYFDAESEMYGYLDCNGEIAIPAKYRFAYPFTDGGIGAVADDTGWYYIDRKGEFIIRPMLYNNGPDNFSEGLARYIDKGKYGFFDEVGNNVVTAQFDFAFPFKNGKAKVGEICTFVQDGAHRRVECESWWDIPRP